MVESAEEYVLQWDAHAKYVTERFSGLFARQAFVDVTLICDEQKLRVHKLVLASSSLYFEEMLQQDLGQEPVIFLDLNFEILKAMVEFMYCGETTIAHQFLPSLLEAAITFKVKELACMVEKTIRPQVESTFYEDQLSDEEFEASNMEKIIEEPKNQTDESNNNHFIFQSNDESNNSGMESSEEVTIETDQDLYSSDTNSKESIFEEVKGDSSNNNCIFSEDTIKIQDPENSEENFEKSSSISDFDFPNQVGQCSRVYTRKRRDQKLPDFCTVEVPDSSPSCINLTEPEPSPVTLPDSDFPTDHIEFGLLKTESDSNPSTTSRDTFEDDSSSEKSSLRRSERLSQQDEFPSKRSSKKRRSKHFEFKKYNRENSKRTKRQSQKVRRKEDKFSKIADAVSDNASSPVAPPRSVTATSIDRALWGDMSDVKDFADGGNWLEYYEADTQIPFAVGLLPLRAALERMQAMPEHQPRKTRSSVTPRHDIFSSRKYVFHRMNLKNEASRENGAVCHIQISTQFRNGMDGGVTSLTGTASVSDEH